MNVNNNQNPLILNNLARHGSLKLGILCQRNKIPQVQNNTVSKVFTDNMLYTAGSIDSNQGPSVNFSTKLVRKGKIRTKEEGQKLVDELVQCLRKKPVAIDKVLGILAKGLNVDQKVSRRYGSAWGVAVARRDLDLMGVLGVNGARSYGKGVDRCFAGKGDLELLKFLVDGGPNNLYVPVGSLLDKAVEIENREMIEYLISKNEPVEPGNVARLIEKKRFDLVELLIPSVKLEYLNSSISYFNGDNLLWVAFCSKNDAIIDALMKRGANFGLRRAINCCGWRDFEDFLKGPRGQALLDPKLIKSWYCYSGKTLLGEALRLGKMDAVKLLRKKGAVIGAEGLVESVKNRKTDLVASLIGAIPAKEIDSAIEGRTLLSYAIDTGDLRMVELMIEAGANLNFPSKLTVGYAGGATWGVKPVERTISPLWQAIPKVSKTGNVHGSFKVEQGNESIAKALIAAGAKLSPELWELEEFRENISKDIQWKDRPEAKEMLKLAHAFVPGYPANVGSFLGPRHEPTPSLRAIVRAMQSEGTINVRKESLKGLPISKLDLNDAFDPMVLSLDIDWKALLKGAKSYWDHSDQNKRLRFRRNRIPFAKLQNEKVLNAIASNKELANQLLQLGLEELAESCFKKSCAQFDKNLDKEEIEGRIKTVHHALVALLKSKAELSPKIIDRYKNNRGITAGVRNVLLERAVSGPMSSASESSSSSSSNAKTV